MSCSSDAPFRTQRAAIDRMIGSGSMDTCCAFRLYAQFSTLSLRVDRRKVESEYTDTCTSDQGCLDEGSS